MQETPSELNDEALLEMWLRFGVEYEQLGYRRKSYELFAKYLAGKFPHLDLSSGEIRRRIHTTKKRLRQRQTREA